MSNQLMNDMVLFTSEVMKHCQIDAQHSTEVVMNALSYLATKEKSDEIRESLGEIKTGQLKEARHHDVISKVTATIPAYTEQDEIRRKLMAPIIQQLQFQDYIQQQMDILIKMLNVWLQMRENLETSDNPQAHIDELGAALAALCVTEPEKETIKRHIPSVVVSRPADDDDLFF